MNCEGIRFILDGKVITLDKLPPTTTLLQYLREGLGRTGTKEGCAEGDCGACTVVEGELCGSRIVYRAVNSCIRFIASFDGKEIVTVESLQSPAGKLHPVQQALVDCHGSQCGFCTPGFVMSLFALYLEDAAPGRAKVVDYLSGNLCRCTGYRPIIDAAAVAMILPEPEVWSRHDAQSESRRALHASITRTHSLNIAVAPGYVAPRALDELAGCYENNPGAVLLAGGTDIGLWVTKQLRDLPSIIYIGNVVGLATISETMDRIEIGAAVRLHEAYQAICAHYPALEELANRFASIPIRNSATLCGNLANGSPIGDSMPILLALGATLVLRRGGQTRTLPLDEFYLGYQKKALEPGEFIAAVRIPILHDSAGVKIVVASYKIAKRFDQDISALCGAYVVRIEAGLVTAARIAYGGMAATPQRARHSETALIGRPWSEDSLVAAGKAIAQDYRPISDMRASANYRLQVAGNLLKRLYLEHDAAATFPTRIPAVSTALRVESP
ncbi:MAG: xanthine dehydrogenase small subunit [Gammaproteobacteria bacterium]|nr:xanthine dehydrogenase small subunit [Gammaproteobacteria bacterium]